MDEDWLYYVEGGGRGVACLARLRLLCSSCHLAKHQGYALVTGRSRRALAHLARVNRVSLGEARRLVRKAFRIHRELSRIRNWVIRVSKLPGMSEELRVGAERLLNTMYRRGFSVSGAWLYYRSKVHGKTVARRAAIETIQVLREAAEQLDEIGAELGSWERPLETLLQAVREELEPLGIRVLEHEFRMFLHYLLGYEGPRSGLEQLLEAIESDDPIGLEAIELLDSAELTGKWIVYASTDVYPSLFRRLVEALEGSGLAYEAKILARARDYMERRSLPIIVYVPSALAPRLVADTADALRRMLEEFPEESYRLTFKPDLFTGGEPSTSIYVYQPE